MLTGTVPDIRDIVLFRSRCNVYHASRNYSLQLRAQFAKSNGISVKTKGYKVYLREKTRVILAQHAKNIDTLSDAQNSQIQHAMNNNDRDVTARNLISAASSAPKTEKNDGVTKTEIRKKSKEQ